MFTPLKQKREFNARELMQVGWKSPSASPRVWHRAGAPPVELELGSGAGKGDL